MFPFVFSKELHAKAFKEKRITYGKYSDNQGKFMAAAAPIFNSGGKIVAIYELCFDLRDLEIVNREFVITLIKGIIFSSTIYITIFLSIAFFFIYPLKRIVFAMLKVGEGNLEQKVEIKRNDEIGTVGENFNIMVKGLQEKERIRDVMNKTVSAKIAERMLKDQIKLGGEKIDATLMFVDIRGFTAMSEQMSPEEIIEMLNDYMSHMAEIIDNNMGVIDKYIGDAIMAIFGASLPILDDKKNHLDALMAVKSAILMIKKCREINKKREELGKSPINVGIGLNSGEVVAGNMGSLKRLNYTVLGDNVNIASRLCDKADKMMILISEATYLYVKDYVVAVEMPPLKVKGKEKELKVYSVLDLKNS